MLQKWSITWSQVAAFSPSIHICIKTMTEGEVFWSWFGISPRIYRGVASLNGRIFSSSLRILCDLIFCLRRFLSKVLLRFCFLFQLTNCRLECDFCINRLRERCAQLDRWTMLKCERYSNENSVCVLFAVSRFYSVLFGSIRFHSVQFAQIGSSSINRLHPSTLYAISILLPSSALHVFIVSFPTQGSPFSHEDSLMLETLAVTGPNQSYVTTSWLVLIAFVSGWFVKSCMNTCEHWIEGCLHLTSLTSIAEKQSYCKNSLGFDFAFHFPPHLFAAQSSLWFWFYRFFNLLHQNQRDLNFLECARKTCSSRLSRWRNWRNQFLARNSSLLSCDDASCDGWPLHPSPSSPRCVMA